MSNFDNLKKELLASGILVIGETKDFVGNMKKYDFQCKEGHLWSGRLDNVKRGLTRESKGCPECAKIIKNNSSSEQATLKLIPGHKIISTDNKAGINDDGIGRKEKMFKIQCEHGHFYEKRNSEIKEGCPECSKKTFVGQERTRLIFEANFRTAFPTVRPDWLKNPETGKNLEIDGYSEELKIGFEYQGNQHYDNNTQFAGELDKQLKRDELKAQLAKENGVHLIFIKQSRSYDTNRFFNYVVSQIKAEGLPITLEAKDVDFNVINDSNTLVKKYEDFKAFVDKTSFKLVSTQLSTMYDVVDFECEHGHSFQMKCAVFKNIANKVKYRDEACPHCHKENSTQKVREVITIDTCHEIAKNLGYKCHSTTYTNVNEPLSWSCKHGHPFTKTYRQMIRNQTGKFCPECASLGLEDTHSIYDSKVNINQSKVTQSSEGEVLNFEWLKNFAKKGGIEVLSDSYLGMDLKHNFKCKNNHLFTSTISNLRDKEKRRTVFCVECGDRAIVNIDVCKKFGLDNNLECLSSEYKNVNEKLNWKCVHNGHIFEKSFRQMQRNKTGKYCPECK